MKNCNKKTKIKNYMHRILFIVDRKLCKKNCIQMKDFSFVLLCKFRCVCKRVC